MKIGIDARMINRRRHTGIARYARNLIGNLLELDEGNSYTLFLKQQDTETIDTPGASKRITNTPIYSLGEQLSFARAIARENLEVFHSPHYVLPLAYRGRSIITVHDLTHLYFPASRSANIYARLLLPLVTKKAAGIVTDSIATKRDLIKRLGIDEGKVHVINLGVEDAFRQITDPKLLSSFREKRGLPERFILYTGATKPHKNIPVLLGALAKLKNQIPLVMTANKDSFEDQAIGESLEKLNIQDKVIFIGFLPDEEMPLLYNSATVLVLPSLYEGFGFPVVEAMACGLPVICSNTSSLPEVVEEAALTFTPTDSYELSEKLTSLLSEPDLYEELRSKGVSRTKTFSWEKTAMATLQLYEEIASMHI